MTRSSTTMWLLASALAAGACDGDSTPVDTTPPSVAQPNVAQAATVGVSFTYDATKSGTAFTDPSGRGLTYATALTPPTLGLTATGGVISGVPTGPGVVRATVLATDKIGQSAMQAFHVAVFAAGLQTPTVGAFTYTDPLPPHFVNGGGLTVGATNNTPATNPTTNAGAALGRALFYDKRLSANDVTACASCHIQSLGFSDSARFSRGFAGGRTARHSMGLANATFYQRGRAFWDERAITLEDQALRPIQDPLEMGLTLDNLIVKLTAAGYYAALFNAAFGTPDITADRIGRALAQFVRSLRSTQSRFDRSFPPPPGGPPSTPLTPQEQQGLNLFNGPAGCAPCHTTAAQVSDNVHNTGLDSVIADVGAGNGRFKAPSLRNIAVRPPFMHDGRFTTLEQVVQFYDSGVRMNPGLDPRLRDTVPNQNQPKRLNLSQAQRDALVAYLRTLTDSTFLTAPKFSSPFPP
jgi:cytochrome c peroxidase